MTANIENDVLIPLLATCKVNCVKMCISVNHRIKKNTKNPRWACFGIPKALSKIYWSELGKLSNYKLCHCEICTPFCAEFLGQNYVYQCCKLNYIKKIVFYIKLLWSIGFYLLTGDFYLHFIIWKRCINYWCFTAFEFNSGEWNHYLFLRNMINCNKY